MIYQAFQQHIRSIHGIHIQDINPCRTTCREGHEVVKLWTPIPKNNGSWWPVRENLEVLIYFLHRHFWGINLEGIFFKVGMLNGMNNSHQLTQHFLCKWNRCLVGSGSRVAIFGTILPAPRRAQSGYLGPWCGPRQLGWWWWWWWWWWW